MILKVKEVAKKFKRWFLGCQFSWRNTQCHDGEYTGSCYYRWYLVNYRIKIIKPVIETERDFVQVELKAERLALGYVSYTYESGYSNQHLDFTKNVIMDWVDGLEKELFPPLRRKEKRAGQHVL